MRPGGNGDFTALAAIGLGLLTSIAITRSGPSEPPLHLDTEPVFVQAHRGPVATPGIAFYASNLDEYDAVVLGDFGGRVHHELGGIRMDAENVAIRSGLGSDEGSTLVGLRLALVEATSDGWREVRSGPTHPAELALDDRAIRLAELGLTLPQVDESELVGRWLAVIHVVRTNDGRRIESAVHADEAVLDRLMGWADHDC